MFNTHRQFKRKVQGLLGMATIVFLIMSSIGCATDFAVSRPTVSSPANQSSPGNNPPLRVSFLDVGQADSALIQLPNGKNILIDAGNNEDAPEIISYIKEQGITRLDIVVGTHPHEDHIGSLDKVIQTFEIGQVLMPKVTTTTQTFKDVLTAIQEKGLKITEAKVGLKLDLGSNEEGGKELSAELLAPKASRYEDMNNYSVVLRLEYGQNAFLFTGDAEDVSEKEMLNSSQDINVDVLKVGHHGSTSSTTLDFLKRVDPEYAVISVGKDNTYGHPAQTTLNRIDKYGVKIYRTDELGTIVVESDGTKLDWSFE